MYYFWRTMVPRRSWAKGVERVQKWSFDNYTETDCWERMRFHRHQLLVLLRELELHRSGDPDGKWRVRDEDSSTRYSFEPMELLVILLTRLSSPNTWHNLLKFLGGRSFLIGVQGWVLLHVALCLRSIPCSHRRYHAVARSCSAFRESNTCGSAGKLLHWIRRRDLSSMREANVRGAVHLFRILQGPWDQVSERGRAKRSDH